MIRILGLMLISTLVSASSIYGFKVKDAKGETFDLGEYKGRSLLFVNIATRCGYTGQLDDLEKVYQKYKDKNLLVIGIPSNDFGGQTPEGDKAVVEFCRRSFGVSFPILTKMKVVGEDMNLLIKYILSKSTHEQIKWNFEKFLFDKNGKLVKSFRSSVTPMSKELISIIESSL